MEQHTQRLSALLMPVLTMVETTYQQLDLPLGEFKQQLIQRLDQIRVQAAQAGYLAQDIDQALFAVVAWIDEKVMTSDISGVMEWRLAPLQRHYFLTNKAGEIFYQRLAQLESQQRAVKEIYALVLIAGFKGQYSSKGGQSTAPLITQLLGELKTDRVLSSLSSEGPLFFDLPVSSKGLTRFRSQYSPTASLLLLAGLPIVMVLLAFLYLDLSLGSLVTSFTERH